MSKDSPIKPNAKITPTLLPSDTTQSKYTQCLSTVTSAEHVPWHGGCYLPPCNCFNIASSSDTCKESKNLKPYDFKSLADPKVQSNVINLMDYIVPDKDNKNNHTSLILCEKYSIRPIPCDTSYESIIKSKEYENKLELLQKDLKLLDPFSGTSFIFKSRNTKRKDITQIKFEVKCNKSRAYTPSKSKKSKPSITSKQCTTTKSRQCTNNLCPYRINFFLDTSTCNWYIKHKGGHTCHSNHAKLSLRHNSSSTKHLTATMLKQIEVFASACVGSSTQRTILKSATQTHIPLQTLINKKSLESREQSEQKMTDAEQLLHEIKSRDNVSWFAMYAESGNHQALTIPHISSSKKATRNNIKMTGFIRVYQDVEPRECSPQLDSTLQEIVEQLIVKNKKKQVRVLLAVGWARDEDLRVFHKFPESIKLDCTANTNREQRPLFNLVCKDSNNRLYTVLRCLLPSEKGAVFDTIINSVFPSILGKTACERVKAVITDGDAQEINACQKACKTLFINATHITCFWHMIHQSIKGCSAISSAYRLRHAFIHFTFFAATQSETKKEFDSLICHLKVRMISHYYNLCHTKIVNTYICYFHHFCIQVLSTNYRRTKC